MRRLIFLLALATPAFAGLVGTPQSCGSNPGCTTTAMNATGATLLIAEVGGFESISSSNISSSPYNAWTCTANQASGALVQGAVCYVLAPSVSSSLTVSVSGSSYTSVAVLAYSGPTTVLGSATGSGNTGTTAQPGSQTAGSTDLVVTGSVGYPATASVTAPFSVTTQGGTVTAAIGYSTGTAGALNPTWTMSGSTQGIATSMIRFDGGSVAGTLSVGSATLSANGTTLTMPISNCSTPLSPTSGITGFTVKVSSVPVYLSSVSASGCTVTATLGSAQQSGDTMTVDLANSGGSNLTDAASNTPVGQTGVAITNNSTSTGATASYNTTNVFNLGTWATSGSNYAATYYPAASVEFSCTNATDAQIYGPSTGIIARADSGSYTTITPVASGYSWQPIATGLSLGTHVFKVITASYVQASSLRCTGSSAAITSSTYTGGTFYSPSASPYTTYAANFGAPSVAANQGLAWQYYTGSIGINTNSTSIGVYTYGNGNTWQVYQDGASTALASGTLPNSSNYEYLTVATGLSGTHSYRIVDAGPNGSTLMVELFLNGGSGFTSAATAASANLYACGDSITALYELQQNSQLFTLGDFWLSTYPVVAGSQNNGVGGAQVSGGATPLDTYCAASTLGAPVKAVLLAGGVNDQIQGVTGSTLQTAYGTMLTNVAAKSGLLASGGKIIVRAILPNCTTNSANRSTLNTAIAAAVTTYNGGSPTYPATYIPTDNWFDPTNSTLVNGCLHPNAPGYAIIGNLETPIMATVAGKSSYSLTGPGSMVKGQATTFTVSLAGGATWTGATSPAETLTCSDSGAGGTFSPSQPFAPTAGGNSATFTYTPSTTGNKTISCVAAQAGWTDPAGLTLPTNATSGAGFLIMIP